jgi:ankyrin repeat protein
MRVFVSHKLAEGEFAHRLASRLQQEGIDTTFVVQETADRLVENIRQEIDSADVLLALLTPTYVESEWLRIEAMIALRRENLLEQEVLVPVLVSACAVPEYLGRAPVADFTDPAAFEEQSRALASYLKGERRRAPSCRAPDATVTAAGVSQQRTVGQDIAREPGQDKLYQAVIRDEPWTVAELLQAGADPNAKHYEKHLTLLHAAVDRERLRVVELLLEAAADPNARASNSSGYTPLQRCCIYGTIGCARILLKGGAHIDGRDALGQTALHYAAGLGRPAMGIFLLRGRADVNARDSRGSTPLHETILQFTMSRGGDEWDRAKELADHVGMAALLLAYGADCLLEGGILGQTPYELALDRRSAIAELLAVHMRATLSLHLTASRCALEETELLLSAGADAQAFDAMGRGPLHVVGATAECSDYVRFGRTAAALVTAGAQPSATDLQGRTAVSCLLVRNRHGTFLAIRAPSTRISLADRWRLRLARCREFVERGGA